MNKTKQRCLAKIFAAGKDGINVRNLIPNERDHLQVLQIEQKIVYDPNRDVWLWKHNPGLRELKRIPKELKCNLFMARKR